ncbi:MAG: hypothetical protein LBV41_09750 [Cytophagaceae bacterium]|jgi:hypothetical protein|nr:hypothetical protein [Cytophagaceae bacterium]
MKVFTFLSILLVGVVITGCSDSNIVGTYQFSRQSDESMSIIGQRTFNEDGSFETNMTMTVKEKAPFGKENYHKFNFSFSGSYSVKDKKISLLTDINTLKVVSEKDDYVFTGTTNRRTSDLAAEMQDNFKQTFASEEMKEEIIEISEEQMTTKEITKEENSEVTVYKRLR